MKGVKSLWNLIHEPPLHDQASADVVGRPLRRLLTRCFLPHWPSLAVAIISMSISGLTVYAYAYAGRVIADDVVQVQLLSLDQPEAADLDIASPTEHRLFGIDQQRTRVGLDGRKANSVGKTTNEKLRLLAIVGMLMILVEAARHFLGFVGSERMIRVGQKVQYSLRQQLHDKLLMLPLEYHDRHTPGRLLTHLFSDVTVIQTQMGSLLQHIPTNILSMTIGIAVIFYLEPNMALMVMAVVPGYVVSYRWFRRRLQVINSNLREREGRLGGHIANRIGSFILVKAFVREQREAIDFVRQTRPLMTNYLASSVLSSGFGVVCGIITGLGMAAVLWVGALRVQYGQMTLGELLMFYASAGYLFSPVAGLTNQVAALHRVRVVAGRILKVLDAPIMRELTDKPLAMPGIACEVRFDKVSMRYQDDRPPALQDISFDLPAGRRLCVMGPSGSGKTTLAKLMCRLYDPSAGTIYYDQTDVRNFQLNDLRRNTGYVSQEPIVFSGTIDDNIRYGSAQASPHAVAAAAGYAQIQDFIDQLPRRYRTLTTERGLTLSGGQKQRLSLARTLLTDPKVLVLDDCTSALDAQTESQLIRAFEESLRGRTVAIVSHRMSIAMECDLVLMLDNGRAIEFGPPEELIKQGGPFAQLRDEQIRKASFSPILTGTDG